MMVNGARLAFGSQAKAPSRSHPSYSRGSASVGAKVLSSVRSISRGPA